MSEKCRAKVWKNWNYYNCTRKAVLDGYCKQHHPDSVSKRREESHKRYQEQWENSTIRRLEKAIERIKALEAEIEELRRAK